MSELPTISLSDAAPGVAWITFDHAPTRNALDLDVLARSAS